MLSPNPNTRNFSWDVSEVASALKISEEDVRAYFTDGRRISFLLERRIAYEVFDGTVAASEGAGYDVLDQDNRKWEVRSISAKGMYFCPSYMVGSGRKFNEQGFLEKLHQIEGYVLSDISKFPTIPYWIVPTEIVSSWWEQRRLGKTTKITRDKAMELLREL